MTATVDFNQQMTDRLTNLIQAHPSLTDTRSVAAAVATNLWGSEHNGVTDVIEDVIRDVDRHRTLSPTQLAAAIWNDIATSAAPSFRIL
jgi:hypothetical protein